MYYATAGQQATQPTNQGARGGMSMGPTGFPPIPGGGGGGGGGLARGGPPGFASRGAGGLPFSFLSQGACWPIFALAHLYISPYAVLIV